MVGPITTGERRSQLLKLKLAVTLLVGLSMGLVAIQSDASLPLVGGAVLVGFLLGASLAWYVFPSADSYKGDDDETAYRR